jgi:hypothetical protein
MMEAVRTSETSVYYNKTTRRSIPEGYHFQTLVKLVDIERAIQTRHFAVAMSLNCGHQRACCEISGSHCEEYEDDSLLGYSAVYPRSRPTLQVRIASIIRTMIMEAVRISETSVYFGATRRYIPKGCHLQRACCSSPT